MSNKKIPKELKGFAAKELKQLKGPSKECGWCRTKAEWAVYDYLEKRYVPYCIVCQEPIE